MQQYFQLNPRCPDGRTCPAVHLRDDRQKFVMQGRLLSAEESAQFSLGPDEVVIELPVDVVEEGMDAYRRSTG